MFKQTKHKGLFPMWVRIPLLGVCAYMAGTMICNMQKFAEQVEVKDTNEDDYVWVTFVDNYETQHSQAWNKTEDVLDAYFNNWPKSEDDELKMRTDLRRSFELLETTGTEDDIRLSLELQNCLHEEELTYLETCLRETWH